MSDEILGTDWISRSVTTGNPVSSIVKASKWEDIPYSDVSAQELAELNNLYEVINDLDLIHEANKDSMRVQAELKVGLHSVCKLNLDDDDDDECNCHIEKTWQRLKRG